MGSPGPATITPQMLLQVAEALQQAGVRLKVNLVLDGPVVVDIALMQRQVSTDTALPPQAQVHAAVICALLSVQSSVRCLQWLTRSHSCCKCASNTRDDIRLGLLDSKSVVTLT